MVFRKLSRRKRPSLPPSTDTPQICIEELKDESEDGYASDSTSDSASEVDYVDTEDTSRQPSPPTHLHGMARHSVHGGSRISQRRGTDHGAWRARVPSLYWGSGQNPWWESFVYFSTKDRPKFKKVMKKTREKTGNPTKSEKQLHNKSMQLNWL